MDDNLGFRAGGLDPTGSYVAMASCASGFAVGRLEAHGAEPVVIQMMPPGWFRISRAIDAPPVKWAISWDGIVLHRESIMAGEVQWVEAPVGALLKSDCDEATTSQWQVRLSSTGVEIVNL